MVLQCVKAAFVAAIATVVGIFVYRSTKSLMFITAMIMAAPVAFLLLRQPYVRLIQLMIGAAFFIPFYIESYVSIYKVANPLTLLGGILCMKILYQLVTERKGQGVTATTIDYLYLFFFISGLISSSGAIAKKGSLNWMVYSLITGYVVYKLISQMDKNDIQKILKTAVFCASICVSYGLVDYIIRRRFFLSGFSIRIASPIGHPLLLGLAVSTVLPISLALFLNNRKQIYLFSSIILLMGVVLTFSRGSWVALLCAFAITGLLFLKKIRMKILLLMGLVVLVVLVGVSPLGRKVYRRINTDETAQYGSFNVRLRSIPIAKRIIEDNLFFGVGPFNAKRHKARYERDYTLQEKSFENTHLGLLMNLGIVGALLFFLIYGIALKKALFTKMPTGAVELGIYKAAIATSLIVMLVNMATFNFDETRLFHFFVWFYVGLSSALVRKDLV